MSQIVFEVTESVEGGFEAQALGHHIFTQGDTWDDLREMVKDAVRAHFDDSDRPSVIRLMFVREEVLSA
jgi:hypothetical protein